MTRQARPNLGGLFDGSTPADRVSGIAGRLGPRVVTAPLGPANESPNPAQPTAGSAPNVQHRNAADPVSWIDPIRVLELYFGLLQAALDANRQFVMGVAGVVVNGGGNLRSGLESIRARH
jgi:hypothetical protein